MMTAFLISMLWAGAGLAVLGGGYYVTQLLQ